MASLWITVFALKNLQPSSTHSAPQTLFPHIKTSILTICLPSILPGSSIWVCLSLLAMTERTSQNPDPADPEGLRLAISQQGMLLSRQADALTQMSATQQELFRRLDNLMQTLAGVTSQTASSVTAASPASGDLTTVMSASLEENIRSQPEPFHGDVEACGGFLLQCRLIFQQSPRYYQSDQRKLSLVAFLAVNPVTHLTYEHFIEELKTKPQLPSFLPPASLAASPGTLKTKCCKPKVRNPTTRTPLTVLSMSLNPSGLTPSHGPTPFALPATAG
uniref:Uncharacterized protein n=1 Tax=Oryzias latipes TaxID=8090 RepID=A0A3P9LZ99_ORYLA